MPRLTMTSRSCWRSLFMNAVNASGVAPTGTAPVASTRSLTSGKLSALMISSLSRLMMAGGVSAGIAIPQVCEISYPGSASCLQFARFRWLTRLGRMEEALACGQRAQ